MPWRSLSILCTSSENPGRSLGSCSQHLFIMAYLQVAQFPLFSAANYINFATWINHTCGYTASRWPAFGIDKVGTYELVSTDFYQDLVYYKHGFVFSCQYTDDVAMRTCCRHMQYCLACQVSGHSWVPLLGTLGGVLLDRESYQCWKSPSRSLHKTTIERNWIMIAL